VVHFETKGSADFGRVAEKLRIAEREFQPEMGKALSEGARPLPQNARQSALEKLPHRGKLNVIVASARIRIRRLSDREVDVVARGIKQLANINEGRINHPTYGHRPRETQLLPRAKGWFSTPMHNGKRRISRALGKHMHEITKRITR
jgi:hypothetical protein